MDSSWVFGRTRRTSGGDHRGYGDQDDHLDKRHQVPIPSPHYWI
jgi:hypothetical protein